MSERGGGLSLPGAPTQTPGLPENFSPIIFEEFAGLNTKALRPAIRDGEMSWCDGFMPIGPNNARTLLGIGPTVASFQGIVWFGFGNIGTTNYCYVLQSNGRLQSVIMPNGQRPTVVMPTGTIVNPRSIMGFSQWGAKYAIFATDQPNGYWLWDGNNLFGAGGVGPEVNVDASGQGYTVQPSYTILTTGGGAGVQLSFDILNQSIDKVTVTNPGSGFGAHDFIVASVQGGGADSQAIAAVPILTPQQGGLASVFVITGGNGYTGFAYAIVTGGKGATISLAIQNGTITGAAIVTAGHGFDSEPVITIMDPGVPGTPPVPPGSGGSVGATIGLGQILGIGIRSGGSGYTSPPTVKIVGDGTNAAAVATIQDGQVTDIIMTNRGQGYTVALAVLEGGNKAANITLALMPFGVSGTTVEVYEDHVWVSNGAATQPFPPPNRTIFSDPNTPVGFGNGGGAFATNDSFLRVGYKALKQSNGFLYLIGDSSMNYISGVQTSSSGSANVPAIPVTTFGNVNVDPQIGTPWPGSVQVFSRNIVFANTVGVHVSYGGAVRKVSDALDGFYDTNDEIFAAAANFTSAVAHIFNIPVYMLLLPVVSPFSGQLERIFLMWDGRRWWTSHQEVPINFIATYEQNSVLAAYGTDGTNIFRLFFQKSNGFVKIIQSKLFSSPAYFATKQSRSLSGILQHHDLTGGILFVNVDSEAGAGAGNAHVPVAPSEGVIWTNAGGAVVSWTNALNQTVTWGGTLINVFGPYPVGQQGRLIGMTLETTYADIRLVSLMLADMVESPNV